MLLLIAMPLAGVVYLALHQSYVKTELVELTTEVPLFGGLKRQVTRTVPQPVLDENGRTIKVWKFVGGHNLAQAAEVEGLDEVLSGAREVTSLRSFIAELHREVTNVDFWSALEFTLLYTFGTTPFVLVIGLALALGVNRASERLRGTMVFVSILPMIVTPVVSSLAVYWLFLDGAVIASLIEGPRLRTVLLPCRPVHHPCPHHRLRHLVRRPIRLHHPLRGSPDRAERSA